MVGSRRQIFPFGRAPDLDRFCEDKILHTLYRHLERRQAHWMATVNTSSLVNLKVKINGLNWPNRFLPVHEPKSPKERAPALRFERARQGHHDDHSSRCHRVIFHQVAFDATCQAFGPSSD